MYKLSLYLFIAGQFLFSLKAVGEIHFFNESCIGIRLDPADAKMRPLAPFLEIIISQPLDDGDFDASKTWRLPLLHSRMQYQNRNVGRFVLPNSRFVSARRTGTSSYAKGRNLSYLFDEEGDGVVVLSEMKSGVRYYFNAEDKRLSRIENPKDVTRIDLTYTKSSVEVAISKGNNGDDEAVYVFELGVYGNLKSIIYDNKNLLNIELREIMIDADKSDHANVDSECWLETQFNYLGATLEVEYLFVEGFPHGMRAVGSWGQMMDVFFPGEHLKTIKGEDKLRVRRATRNYVPPAPQVSYLGRASNKIRKELLQKLTTGNYFKIQLGGKHCFISMGTGVPTFDLWNAEKYAKFQIEHYLNPRIVTTTEDGRKLIYPYHEDFDPVGLCSFFQTASGRDLLKKIGVL